MVVLCLWENPLSARDSIIIEGKRVVMVETTIRELSQSIATMLTFAWTQQKSHDGLHTFPTLRVHPIGIDIILYNTLSDHLMLTCLKWSDSRNIPTLYLTIVTMPQLFWTSPKNISSIFVTFTKSDGKMKCAMLNYKE